MSYIACVRIFQEVHACASVMQDQVIDMGWRFACMLAYASKTLLSWSMARMGERLWSRKAPVYPGRNLLKSIAGTHFILTPKRVIDRIHSGMIDSPSLSCNAE